MKIIINSRIYTERFSGIQNYLEQLAFWLQKEDPSTEYIFHQTKQTKPLGETRIYGYIPTQLGKIFFDLLGILQGMRKEKGDIFFAPAFTLPFFKLQKYKYVATIHDLAFLIYPELYNSTYRTYMTWMLGWTLRHADALITVSESTRNDLLKFFPHIKKEIVHAIPLGVSGLFFDEIHEPPMIAGEYFLSVTTHPKRKNILRILEIIGANKDFFKGKKYVIAGILKGQSLELIESLLEKYDIKEYVVLFGYAEKKALQNLYKYAEFFLYPSYYEGFGLPVLEAMATGTLVLSSSSSSLKEVNPHAGFQFDPNDSDEIFSTMKRLYDMKIEERARIAIEQKEFAKGFSWQKTAKKTIEVFQNITSHESNT